MVHGYVGIAPDFMGYGSNSGLLSRVGYIVKNSYVTATLPILLKTKLLLNIKTNDKTRIADGAFYSGYSEGAYASISLAEGLKEAMNVIPLRVFAGK